MSAAQGLTNRRKLECGSRNENAVQQGHDTDLHLLSLPKELLCHVLQLSHDKRNGWSAGSWFSVAATCKAFHSVMRGSCGVSVVLSPSTVEDRLSLENQLQLCARSAPLRSLELLLASKVATTDDFHHYFDQRHGVVRNGVAPKLLECLSLATNKMPSQFSATYFQPFTGLKELALSRLHSSQLSNFLSALDTLPLLTKLDCEALLPQLPSMHFKCSHTSLARITLRLCRAEPLHKQPNYYPVSLELSGCTHLRQVGLSSPDKLNYAALQAPASCTSLCLCASDSIVQADFINALPSELQVLVLWANPQMDASNWVRVTRRLADLIICCYNFDVNALVPVLPKARYMLLNVRSRPLGVESMAQLFEGTSGLEYAEIFLKSCSQQEYGHVLDLAAAKQLHMRRENSGPSEEPQFLVFNKGKMLTKGASSALLGVQCWTLNLEMHNCKMKLRSILGE